VYGVNAMMMTAIIGDCAGCDHFICQGENRCSIEIQVSIDIRDDDGEIKKK
jgi:hypothetical protein